jgi:AraC-like DNA-binding protein
VGSTASILVRFTPQGATCLGVPASELTSRSVPLDALLPSARAREVQERLLGAATDVERVAVVERLLLELPFVQDRLIERALAMLSEARDPDARVASVARALSLSERQLERRFLARVGITPNRFASLRRFERAVSLARDAPSLAAAALDAGYYDQAHFIRDARRFAGATPGQLRAMSDSSNR